METGILSQSSIPQDITKHESRPSPTFLACNLGQFGQDLVEIGSILAEISANVSEDTMEFDLDKHGGNDIDTNSHTPNPHGGHSPNSKGGHTLNPHGHTPNPLVIPPPSPPYENNLLVGIAPEAFSNQTHERILVAGRPHSCNYCEKTFKKSGHAKDHERTHTGEKPYPCNYCDKRFTQSSHRKDHERIHTGKKPYTCRYCVKTFTTSNHIKKHERTHTCEKLYSCRYCAKKFTTSNHIKKHEGVHRLEKSRAATRRLSCLPKIYPGGPEKYIMQQLLQLKKKRRKNNVV